MGREAAGCTILQPVRPLSAQTIGFISNTDGVYYYMPYDLDSECAGSVYYEMPFCDMSPTTSGPVCKM